MNRLPIGTLSDVIRRGMCTGCGNCVAACPAGSVRLRDVSGSGLRPRFAPTCGRSKYYLQICPGYETKSYPLNTGDMGVRTDPFLGEFLELWEGWAADPEIRLRGSSGGVLSALAVYCLDYKGVSGVLHTGPDPAKPWRNRTHFSRTYDEIIQRAGSRYSPASPCEGLRILEREIEPGVFIGKPTDATAAQLLRRVRPSLDRNLSLVMSFFCAGTPSTQGTLDLLDYLRVDPKDLATLAYRGNGWPGGFEAVTKDGKRAFIPYHEAWRRLTHYKPLRENLEPDGFGRNADISCGDAWHIKDREGNPGVSVIVVRTERGRQILRGAEKGKYVVLRPTTADQILKGQASLVDKQRELYGRLLAFRLFGIPRTRFTGFALKQRWRELPCSRRIQAFLGTIRRIFTRKLWRSLILNSEE